MKRGASLRFGLLFLLLAFCVTIAGISAEWLYLGPAEEVTADTVPDIANFRYGQLYITDTRITGGSYSAAALTKTGDTTASAAFDMGGSASASVTAEVTFYNSTNVTYYYDETLVTSSDNENFVFSVSGMAQLDQVPSNTYKTLSLTFTYNNTANITNTLYNIALDFKFTIDKESIDDVVANTAVERFEEILNNIVTEDTYDTLISAMDDRSGWNKGSSITYIGNVAGADSGDSAKIQELFGEDMLTMDLDGDGVTEPVTMMIKRENVDDNAATGDSYTYTTTSWGQTTENTVNGVEMTLYITAHDFTNTRRGDDVVVYAAIFTRLPGSSEWTELVPLTKGVAEANSYDGGWGSADSFNTDTWRSDGGSTITQLATAASAK